LASEAIDNEEEVLCALSDVRRSDEEDAEAFAERCYASHNHQPLTSNR
jgi:hypothetical protein